MGKSGLVSCGVTAPLSWVLVHTKFCLCPSRIYFPVLCKFWQLYGGVNGDLLHEDLCHTQVCCTPHLLRRCSNTVLAQSLWGLWVLLWTRFVWALWASLSEMGFDSKCEFVPPTILLGQLCPWTWGISSPLLQNSTAATPVTVAATPAGTIRWRSVNHAMGRVYFFLFCAMNILHKIESLEGIFLINYFYLSKIYYF